MIEGPCSGKADIPASEADVVALTATVAGNTSTIGTKARPSTTATDTTAFNFQGNAAKRTSISAIILATMLIPVK